MQLQQAQQTFFGELHQAFLFSSSLSAFSVNCVSTQPGEIELTVILYSANSNAKAFENPKYADFVALYKLAFASPTTPEIEAILTILPNFFVSYKEQQGLLNNSAR